MGFLFRFFLGFIIIYFVLKAFFSILTGKRTRRYSNQRQQQANQPRKPYNQQDRITEYNKKNFELSEIEDADFEEVKEDTET